MKKYILIVAEEDYQIHDFETLKETKQYINNWQLEQYVIALTYQEKF